METAWGEDASRAARIRIGISGWRYPPWRGGAFYPDRLPQRRELAYAAGMLPTIELNGSFYSLQRPTSYQSWFDETPDDFVFAVKGGRYITHLRRLVDVATPLANFFASGVLALGAKLGPLLWQLPPNLAYDAQRIEDFLALLPADTDAASALARRHDQRLDGRTHLAIDASRPLRHAIEVRHDSFRDQAFVAQLRRHGVALVVADTAGRWPLLEDATADFRYVRLHGDAELYASGYGDAALDHWAGRLAAWSSGQQPADSVLAAPSERPPITGPQDVYVYFDNDIKVHAPFDAARLARRLGLPSPLLGTDAARAHLA